MANASAKKIAAQNEKTIKILRLGMIFPTVLSLLVRLIFRRASLPLSKASLAIYIVTFIPMFLLSNYLVKIGSPRRDTSTGTLISSGEDLGQPGVTEWCFDILYITWACQIGSGAFGEWVWTLYLIIPLYGTYKLFSFVIYPMLRGSPGDIDEGKETSKRQEKLKKRAERGDPRVRTRSTR